MVLFTSKYLWMRWKIYMGIHRKFASHLVITIIMIIIIKKSSFSAYLIVPGIVVNT